MSDSGQQQFARHDLLIPATLPLGNERSLLCSTALRFLLADRSCSYLHSSSSWRKGREKERKKERKDDFRQLLPSFPPRDIARVYVAICPTHSYCAIELMAKEKSERKPTDELDLWWKLVARRSKENNLWIERNGCNVFFRSGRRLLYVKLIPRSGERFSIQGYSR